VRTLGDVLRVKESCTAGEDMLVLFLIDGVGSDYCNMYSRKRLSSRLFNRDNA
jgi:hypothetical protein